MKKKKKFFKGIALYDWYFIPTIYVYSRKKDTTTIELRFLKFYCGWSDA